ncbi:uncharacterized protein LOC5504594 isoform X2 [Nematostella vectensis]|nr:uncharacterized protein LOC5504594 isoform X2 [Nematostella vectensis]XP_048583371.1 uncharacterized protein LOC5504594 isoform X2 [Nematostella vectensis]
MWTKPPRGPSEMPSKPYLDFDVNFALECLLSRGYSVTDRVTRAFYDVLRDPNHDKNKVCNALNILIAAVEKDRFCPLEEIFRGLVGGYKALSELEVPTHFVYVPRIIITPTRDFFVQPELVAENRVIREYGHEFSMRIAFRDEDFSKLSASSPGGLSLLLEERVKGVLSSGVSIGGRRYEFLACSNSQLRQHGAWLYAHDGEHDAAEIRSKLGDLEEIRCVAVFVSRMGQCFSSTKKSVEVSLDNGVRIEKIPDVEKEYNNVLFPCCGNVRSGVYIFSDGIGKISKDLANKVAKSLGLEAVEVFPSAYQIRYAGCKGMLAVDPSLRGEVLQYRDSMKKFQSSHKALEICEPSRPNRLYFNRQCITLLSGLGVPDDEFIRLQDKMLMDLASMLLYETSALESLGRISIAGGLKVSLIRHSGIVVTCEPFFRSMLLAIYRSRLGDLLRRARIAIPESHGRLLMGVLDETGSLDYGEVFIRYTTELGNPGQGYTILTGDVVVSKNPCFHPGDMRKFNAVDIPALYHLVDCIVFPAKGPRPHTDEMSGSDLDGDKYFATWLRGIIPDRDNEPPMDFYPPKKKMLNRPIEVSDMIQFVADYIKNDQLGVIANAHLVHADSEQDGIFSDKCIKLAHMHSDAVDFPKTGECPELTKELRPEQYPDFMMKPDKPRYVSHNVLGKLFQKCNSLERARRFMTGDSTKDITVDQDMILEGHQSYLEDAIEQRDRYNAKLEALMARYGLENEGEVLTGCLNRVSSRLSGKTDEKFEVAQMIQASLASTRNNLRHEFYEEFGGETNVLDFFKREESFPDGVLQKASAWYAATYQNHPSREREESAMSAAQSSGIPSDFAALSMSHAPGPKTRSMAKKEKENIETVLLSFPWVVDRLLSHIKQEAVKVSQDNGVPKTLEGIQELVSEQARHHFTTLKLTMLEDFEIRRRRRIMTMGLIRVQGVRLCLTGSSLHLLETGGKNVPPVKLFAYFDWSTTKRLQGLNLERLARALEPSYGRQIPRGSPPLLCYKSQSAGSPDLHISADLSQMLKSAYIIAHLLSRPKLIHVLLVLMHWGRRRHIVGEARDSFMSTEDLGVLFLTFCEKEQLVDQISRQSAFEHAKELVSDPTGKEEYIKQEIFGPGLENSDLNTGFGNALVGFFKSYSLDPGGDSENSLNRLQNPVDPGNFLFPEELSNEQIKRFCDAALHAYHEIATCNGLDSLLKNSDQDLLKELEESLSLPRTTWGAVRFAEDFVSIGLKKLTGASIFIRPVKKGPGYVMEITGTYLTLFKAQTELYRMEQLTQDTSAYNHLVKNGKRFIFMGQSGPLDNVCAKQLKKGDFALNLIEVTSESGVDEVKLVKAVEEQFKVTELRLDYLHGSRDLRVSVEFGSIYVCNGHQWVIGAKVQQVEDTLRRGGAHGSPSVKWNPQRTFAQSWRAAFPDAVQTSTTSKYVLEVKQGKHSGLTIVFNDKLEFESFRTPPFRWLEVDMKSPRATSARTADTDIRLIMTSQREITREDAESLPNYQSYASQRMLQMENNNVSIAPAFRSKVASPRKEMTSIYRVSTGVVFLEECTSVGIGPNTQAKTNVTLFAKELSGDAPREAAKAVLRAAKTLRPYIR